MDIKRITGMKEIEKFLKFAYDLPILGILLGLAIIIIGVSCARLPSAVGSHSWPTTEGKILKSRVQETWSYDGDDWGPGWKADIEYSYRVNGKRYVSDQIEVVDIINGNGDSIANKVVNRYPKGSLVTVYYKTDDPTTALLEPGLPNNDLSGSMFFLTLTGMGAIIMIIGLAGAYSSVKRGSQFRPNA